MKKVRLINKQSKRLVILLLLVLIPGVAVASNMIHNSATVGSTKWGGNWGVAGGQYGEFTCATCHDKNTGNIKRIKKDIVAPNSPAEQFPMETGGTQVNFLDAREGQSDFGDDSAAGRLADGVTDTTSDKICEACHTQTKFHNYDATLNAGNGGDRNHYNDADCMVCHPHSDGFKPLDCTACHGYPPTTTDNDGSTTTGLAHNPYTSGSTTAGAHQKHAVDLGYGCENCHDGYTMPVESTVNSGFSDISIGFNNYGSTSGTYSGQAGLSYNDTLGTGGENCNNVYCHSTGQSADGTSATPSAYSTPSWSTPASGACGTCHDANDPGTGSHTVHINDGADCSSCHNDAVAGTTVPTTIHVSGTIDVYNSAAGDLGYTAGGARGNGYGTCNTANCHDQGRGGLATTPTWGNSVTDCTECHNGSGMATGSHTVHLAAAIAGTAIDCTDCHDGATDPSTETPPAVGHRDDNIDVVAGSYPADKAKNTAFANCSTATCHQTGQSTNDYTVTSNWGTDDANCTQCHAAVPATGSHDTHVNTAGYDCSQCHTNATKDTSYNDANHGDVTIDVAVGNYITNRGNSNYGTAYTSCDNIACHGDGLNAGGGNTPTWGTAAGCTACHDTVNDGTGSHAVHLVETGNACISCHDNADVAGTAPGQHADGNVDVYNSAAGDLGYPQDAAIGSGSWSTCSAASCHDQGRGGLATTPTWGTSVTDCSECHASAPTTGSHTVHLAAAIAGTAIACSDCHDAATDPSTETAPASGHRDDNIDVVAGSYPADKAKNTAFANCSTATCHQTGQSTNDYTVTSNWGTDDANCTQCHAAVPATGSHDTHVNTAGYDCSQCHTNATKDTSYNDANHGDVTIDVAVGNYITNRTNDAYGTAFTSCDNIACHGDGLNAGGGNTPTWGTNAGCAACHSATPATGSHSVHLADTGNTCVACHDNADTVGEVAPGQHGDGNVDVYNSAAGDLGYAIDAAIGSASWGTCNVASCHDPGRGALVVTPTWNTAVLNCTECHQGSGMATGSHAAHIADGANCSDCHDAATDPATETAPAAGHRDDNIDTQVAHGYTQNKAKNSAFETCATASCHDTGRNSGLTGTWGTTINNCAECHETQPTTGSHTDHLAFFNCGTCHTGAVEATTAPAGHRDGNIDTAASTGLTANKALGSAFTSCSTNNCHGSGSPVWGTDLDGNDQCTQCHGELVAGPATDSQKAPGGAGVDTNGDSVATDAQVGAHQIHLNPTISGGASCTDCHAVPTAITDAGHIDSALPAELTFSGLALGGLDGQSAVAPANSQAGCATTYCHDGAAFKNGWDGGTLSPTWTDTNFIQGAAADCDNCHGYPPAGSHIANSDCSVCHSNVNADDVSFVDVNLHVDGIVQASGGDNCTDCHVADIDGALNGAHAAHTDTASFLSGKQLSAGDNGGADWYTTTYVSGKPNFACGECHPGEGLSHPTNGLNIDLDPAGESPPGTSPKSKSTDTPTNPTFTSRTNVTCSNIYCHSDALSAGRTYATTPDWYGGSISGNCNDCHGNAPGTGTHANHIVGIHYEDIYGGTSGLMASSGASGAAHGDATTSDPIGCQTCHNNTVAVEFNDQNSVCSTCHDGGTAPLQGNAVINTAGSTHVNTVPDVVFSSLASFKSRAQLRDDITVVTELNDNWTRNNGYKAATSFDQGKVPTPSYAGGSCSNVACHNGITTPTWTTGFNSDCSACHTSLPQ